MRISLNYFYAAGIILLLFAADAIFFLLADIRLILDLIPDDAAYYFKIAENFNKGFGFSFDSIHQTNGFQPLWQYILIALYYIIPSDPETFCRTALIFQVFITSISALLLFHIIKKHKGEAAAFIASGIYILLVFNQSVNGMESALLVFTLVLVYTASMKYSHNYFLLGILCGLLALARIDFFLLIFVWIIVLLSRKELKGSLFISGGFLLLYLPYALTNFFSTGYMEPITGILKSSFPKVNLHFDLQFTVTALISIFTALAASVFYIIFSFSRVFIRRTKNPFLFILASTIIIHFLFYLLFTKWAVLNYYFIFYGVFLAFISAEFINFKKYKITAQIFLTIAALFVFGKLLLNINKDIENSWHAKAYDAAVWAKANTSPGEIFAMKDAGNFAFFSERKVINLDGLVNDYLYQEFLKEKKLNLYLKKNNVSYYVLYESSAAPELWRGEYDKYEETFTSYMYMTECDKISIMKNKEIYRENFAEDINSVFIIWKLE